MSAHHTLAAALVPAFSDGTVSVHIGPSYVTIGQAELKVFIASLQRLVTEPTAPIQVGTPAKTTLADEAQQKECP